EKLAKDYWRKNLSTYLDWPLPDVTAVELALDLDPDRSRLKVEGAYDLINNQEKPLTQVPLTGGLHWESPSWTFEGKDYTPDARSGLYVFTPHEPIPQGGAFRIGFKFEGTFPQGITKRGGGTNEFILPSGVVLTSFSTSFAPRVGFVEGVGIDDDNRYESKEYPDDHFKGQTEAAFGPRRPFRTKITISGPDRLTYNSVGALTNETVENGRRVVVWESDQPVNFYNVVAGNWEVSRGEGTAVFYHKAHPYNVAAMVEALDAARTHYSEWFRPYPWKELKLSEFPALASYAQGFPTDVTFSESIGFLTDDDPEASAAFTITAHEAAHQWWGNMIMPGKGPGGNLLSEGTSHFSTMLLLERARGPRARMEFSRRIEDTYGKNRSADSERPLVKIDGSRDGDQTVTYDKTGWVLWMLMNRMGRESMLAGIRDFFETYHANVDHPVLQDFLAVLRTHAKDPDAFDAFTRQWFFEVVAPEFQVTDAVKRREGNAWVVTATVRNVGGGTVPVEFAASRGERFVKGKPNENADFKEARVSITFGPGDSHEVTIPCDFDPEKFVVDPDVNVLMLRRKAAEAKL
ncbi:MAG: M1 family metallopeptidase, partial [Isosphaeraceae bacterium]